MLMPKNRLSEPEEAFDFRKQLVMCKRLADSTRESAIELQCQISGQAAIESDGEKLIVLYCCYPNGDFLVWFLHQGYFHLSALVNQKFSHVASISATSPEAFQAELYKIQAIIGK